jgi:hypothetical protein
MTNFREYVASIMPPWLRRYWGERFVGGAIGLKADQIAEGASQSIKAHMLRQDTSPDDAMARIGNERNIPRVVTETNLEYRARVLNAWELWTEAGTITFADNVLAPLGLDPDDVTIFAHKDWSPDPDSTHWSRFWVVITNPDPPWQQAIWGSFPTTWGIGTSWGSGATVPEVLDVLKQLIHFKSAHEVGVWVILAYGFVWGVPLWGAGGFSWGDHRVIWPLGHYWGLKYTPHSYGGVEPFDSTNPTPWGVCVHP